mmetsp:Transcript_24314/g.71025  ORF Transcript_24314/g.71025 Transcript_24314/m.71025 type:complete len:258 (+) Transcript_24314:901-1674(+)
MGGGGPQPRRDRENCRRASAGEPLPLEEHPSGQDQAQGQPTPGRGPSLVAGRPRGRQRLLGDCVHRHPRLAGAGAVVPDRLQLLPAPRVGAAHAEPRQAVPDGAPPDRPRPLLSRVAEPLAPPRPCAVPAVLPRRAGGGARGEDALRLRGGAQSAGAREPADARAARHHDARAGHPQGAQRGREEGQRAPRAAVEQLGADSRLGAPGVGRLQPAQLPAAGDAWRGRRGGGGGRGRGGERGRDFRRERQRRRRLRLRL